MKTSIFETIMNFHLHSVINYFRLECVRAPDVFLSATCGSLFLCGLFRCHCCRHGKAWLL